MLVRIMSFRRPYQIMIGVAVRISRLIVLAISFSFRLEWVAQPYSGFNTAPRI
jgi:hypothetical protein